MKLGQRARVRAVMCLPLLMSQPAAEATPATGPLRVHSTNPRYFTDGTKTLQ